MKSAAYAERTWGQLRPTAGVQTSGFDPGTVADLPGPAQRLLLRALPSDTALAMTVELAMEGTIRIGSRWKPFTATQILHAGAGFVWRPVVGGRILRIVGADELGPDGARMEFRLHGRIPIVSASGPDTERSAAGRLAAETVAWLPQALTPQAGAVWTPIDDTRACVSLSTPSGAVEVTTSVADDGRLTGVSLQRWNDSAEPAGYESFGGAVTTEFCTTTDVRIAGAGSAGWQCDRADPDQGTFFTYRIAMARHQ